MANLITVAEVRTVVGISSSEISDADVTAIITDMQSQLEKAMGTKLTPTTTIDILEGTGEDRIFVNKTPLLALRKLEIDTDDITISGVEIFPEAGMLRLTDSCSQSTFKDKPYSTKVKYVYGWADRDSSTQITTSAATVAGTSVQISVSSITGYAADDWIYIYGMDGYREAAKVTSTATGKITVAELSYAHESGSLIEKLFTPYYLLRLLKVMTSIAMVNRIIGESYTDIVGYSLGDMQVQKGEPYTQWRETATQLIREKDNTLKNISPRMVVRV
jgi:hypothetical protein